VLRLLVAATLAHIGAPHIGLSMNMTGQDYYTNPCIQGACNEGIQSHAYISACARHVLGVAENMGVNDRCELDYL
jgi:hypothetical protein